MTNYLGMVLLISVGLAGCSHEILQRTGYETLRNYGQTRCHNENAEPCPPGEGYDDYQRQRKELEQPRQ